MKARQRNFGKAEMAGWLDGKTPLSHPRPCQTAREATLNLTERAVISYPLKARGTGTVAA
jgi:hypothetical protein